MKKKNIPLWKELAKQIEEEKAKKAKAKTVKIPKWLHVCRNPVTKELPKINTIQGDFELTQVIKDKKQLIVIDYIDINDIKSLFELIQTDTPQGNVFGINPYVKTEGFVLPFAKGVKEMVLEQGIKNEILPKNTKYIDHTPASATDIEMRGTCNVIVLDTPKAWMHKGWASDGTAFPTDKYYGVSFIFPYKKIKQNPGITAIFPYNTRAKDFIYNKLIPAYNAGCIWSKKMSVTDGVQVINPNIHLVFDSNQSNRWYSNKIESLEEEMLKYAPAFL
jgi:hypothetical protein